MKHGGNVYENKVNMDFSVNLNPLGIPPEISDALQRSLDNAGRYPDPAQNDVRSSIAHALKLDKDCVYAGSGASQLILASVMALTPSKALLFEPGFSGYRHVLSAAGCPVLSHLLSEENGFAITKEDLKALSPDTDLVFVCDPINPTGLNVRDDVLYKLLERAASYHTAVILDESFYLMSDKASDGFTDRSAKLLSEFDNLYIIRSLTKLLAVPGVRIGYALSDPANIDKLIMQLPEWNLSAAGEEAIKAGMKLITKTDLISKTVKVILNERDFLRTGLKDMGLTVFDSNSLYILFRGPVGLYDRLLEKGILIRDCSDIPGLGPGFYRIAVKTHEDNEILMEAVRGTVNGK